MCKYCEGEFIGDKPITPISETPGGIKLIVEGTHLYAYCQCGCNYVTEIQYCPMCGVKLD